MFERILLAVDGSEYGYKAAKVAADLARCVKAELRILVVYDPIPSYLGEPNVQSVINARLGEAQEILDKVVETVGDLPTEIRTAIVEGNPAEVIINVAKTRESDLIVMGSRGLGRLAGLVLGSTSQKVVSHAPCPVLIVR